MHFSVIRPYAPAVRFGEDVKNADWAVQKLLKAVGVPSDLLGTPKLKDEHLVRMSNIIRELNDAERRVLKVKAERKELSDWQKLDRILPESFERKLVELLDDLL